MLEQYTDYKKLSKILLSRKDYRPFPKYEDREAWSKIDPFYLKSFTSPERKKSILEYDTSALTATAYMERFRTNGKGSGKWSHLTQPRRDYLFDAVISECVEGKGEYIDKIIDLVWAICEETSWVIPDCINHMHNYMFTGVLKNALPDVTEHNFFCIYAACCATALGWTYYFLKDRLDEESPLIAKRIKYELYQRIIIPFMTHEDLTWFGFHGHAINNWNPWILENIIPTCLFVISDEDERVEFMSRALEKFDIYLNHSPKDGASDEGPGYWNLGGCAALDIFEMLRDLTNGEINMFSEPYAKNAAEFIANANMAGDLYANFADSGMEQHVGFNVYRYARLVNSDYLRKFLLSKKGIKNKYPVAITNSYRSLKCLFEDYSIINSEQPTAFVHKDVWLPEAQHLYVRSNDETASLAVKGGTNNESHNHNDLGNFIYVANGEPAIYDLGGPRYDAKAFSLGRYDYWITQSTSHNCVRIGNFQQHDGNMYIAEELSCCLGDENVKLVLDLTNAYERNAKLISYERSFNFNKKTGELVISDDIQTKIPVDADVHFVTKRDVAVHENSVDILMPNGKTVTIECDNTTLSIERHYNINCDEEHFISDETVIDGEHCDCTRIVFTTKDKAIHHCIVSKISHN